jgi:hypothetical protein
MSVAFAQAWPLLPCYLSPLTGAIHKDIAFPRNSPIGDHIPGFPPKMHMWDLLMPHLCSLPDIADDLDKGVLVRACFTRSTCARVRDSSYRSEAKKRL